MKFASFGEEAGKIVISRFIKFLWEDLGEMVE